MKHFLLIFTVLMVGCGGGDGGSNESMNHEAQPPGDSKPVSVSPPTHTKDSLALIKERVAKNEAVLIDVREKDEWDEDDRYREGRSPNDTQFGVSGEIGYKLRIDDRLGLRVSGFFYHDFRSSGRAAKSSLGVGFGFSFFTGGTRRGERSRRR